MDEITLSVPQGVGDIFWVYQKFSPYCKTLNFNILCTIVDKVQQRAKDWLALLPKTGKVDMRVIEGDLYNELVNKRYKMAEVLELLNRGVLADYACNKPLEEGIRLENIDPEYVVESPVDVRADYCPLPYEKFITVYVSGSTKNPDAAKNENLWTMKEWYDFILQFRQRYGNYPVILIGASYDADTASHISAMLKLANVPNTVYIDSYPGNVAYIIKNSVCFLNYQSGLSILADNFNTPQVMLYFPKLEKMMYTWCRTDNIKDVFHADIFSTKPKEVMKKIELKL